MVIALRHGFVGTASPYSQLLIQPKNMHRLPVLCQVTPAYSSVPSSSQRVSVRLGVNVSPSKSPVKYCVAEPPAGPPGLMLTINTHSFLPSAAVKGNRSGHSQTPPCAPKCSPNSLSLVQLLRSLDE